MVKITYEEGIALLKEHGVEWDPLADLDTPTERKLGEIGTHILYYSEIKI